MGGTIFLLAAATVAVDFGWQPRPEGGLEYIIQIEPQMLESLRAGREVFSAIPPELKDVRSYRIRVGTEVLPRDAPTEPPSVGAAPSGAARPMPGTMAQPPAFPIAPDPGRLPERLVVFNEDVGRQAAGTPKPEGGPSAEPNPPRPWMPLTLAVAGLFGSLGGMLYLGWIAWDYRAKYRDLLARMLDANIEPDLQ